MFLNIQIIGHHLQIIKDIIAYNDIKNWYIPNSEIRGGMWDMGERQNKGMWKTTLLLFGSLAIVTVFIIVLSK